MLETGKPLHAFKLKSHGQRVLDARLKGSHKGSVERAGALLAD